jgi:hypothetical protein
VCLPRGDVFDADAADVRLECVVGSPVQRGRGSVVGAVGSRSETDDDDDSTRAGWRDVLL